MYRTVVINVVGLTQSLISEKTPNLNRFFSRYSDIQPIAPALTCSMQSTYLTGKMPSEHGIVGNGWYFRELDQVLLWRQSNRLVQAPSIWNRAREIDQSFSCANTFWWYAMATGADITLTPRPLYCADGLKLPDCYTQPPHLREDLQHQLGQFPLFKFWGPATDISSSRWIANAAMAVEEKYQPSLNLVYLPHLDYCLQRLGPNGAIDQDLEQIDQVCGDLFKFFAERGLRIIVLSEYGISEVDSAVHINRILREAGYLRIKADLGREYLDTASSPAFAVADHQIAHVYIQDKSQIATIKTLCESISGVDRVLDNDGKQHWGLQHPRSGELVLFAKSNTWFSYYFWLDDEKAPDYARIVDIHNKPGYDPVELFIDPTIQFPKLKVAKTLLKKKMGMRYLMDLIPLDTRLVKGSHGLPYNELAPSDGRENPVFASNSPEKYPTAGIAATDVQQLILEHLFSH